MQALKYNDDVIYTNSSAVQRLTYDKLSHTLVVHFSSGRPGCLENVTEDMFRSLEARAHEGDCLFDNCLLVFLAEHCRAWASPLST